MTELMSRKKRWLLICFLIVEAVVIMISFFLIRSIDPKEEPKYFAIEKIPCDALLQQNGEILFIPNGQTQVYQMPVSLMRGEAFDVSFSVDCDDSDGGLIFVDLIGVAGYDSSAAEFRRTALEGQYTISDRINYSGIHPLQCELRIFTLGDVSAKISNIEINRMHKNADGKNIAIICILICNAAMILLAAAYLLSQPSNNLKTFPDKEKKVISCIAFLMILCMQIFLMVFWMQQKSGFYVDELYSMEKAQYFAYYTPNSSHLYENADWQEKTWMPAEKWKETLELSEEESVFFQSPILTVLSLLKDRNYSGFLNMAESIICPGRISKYPGIILNLLFFGFTQIVLFRLLRRMGTSSQMALFGVFWYGFCGMTVSMMEYTRFYVVATCLLILTIDFHLIMWKTDKIRNILLCEIGAFFCAYLAFFDSELIAPLFFFLAILFTIGLLAKKRFIPAACYAIPIFGAGIIFLLAKTPLVSKAVQYLQNADLTQLSQETGDADRIGEMLLHMRNMSLASWLKQLPSAIYVLIEGLFGNWVLFATFLAMFIILLIQRHRLKEKTIIANGFLKVLVGVIVTYFFFMVLAFEIVPRYYFFLIVLIVCVFTGLMSIEITQIRTTLWSGSCVLLVIVGVLSTHLAGDIDYIYREDRAFYQQLEKYKDTDSIVDQSFASFQRSLYECVSSSGNHRKIYPVSELQGQIHIGEDQKEILLWVFPGNDISYYERALVGSGFQWNYLGKSEASEVYLFQRE